jgi:hypothetical protein
MATEKLDSAVVEARATIPPAVWWLVALFPLAVQLFLGLHHLKLSWDDGAITAAFSRTWAETGKIALTPVSQVVEGYSSVLWFLLVSVPYFFSHNGDAGLFWMKFLSAAFAVLSLVIMYRIGLRQFANRGAALASVLLLGYCYTAQQEIDNGMEMNLAMFLTLLLFHLLSREQTRHRAFYSSTVTCLLLLTRFETPFALGLMFCGFLYASYRHRQGTASPRDLLSIFAATGIFFGIVELWRYHTFGVWMPNTIYAKRFVPYRDWSTLHLALQTRLRAMNEPLYVLRIPMVVVLVVVVRAILRKKLSLSLLKQIHPAIWLLAGGCFLFGAMFGQNWGPAGRMVSPMIPFLILVMVALCVNLVEDRKLIAISLAAMATIQGVMWLIHTAHPVRLVSMETVEPLGYGADAIRTALHQDQILIMMSDVGASSLCCERLAVVDSGLLTDKTLAHVGWAGFADYFQKVRPDLVEAHYFWAQDAGIYNGLLNNYSIVASNGIRFFLRNDLYQKLASEHPEKVLPVTSVPVCMTARKEDAAFSMTKRTCLLLNNPGVDNNLP